MIQIENIMELLKSATNGFIVLVGDENAFICAMHGRNKDLVELLSNAAVKSDDFFLSMILAVEAARREREEGGEK